MVFGKSIWTKRRSECLLFKLGLDYTTWNKSHFCVLAPNAKLEYPGGNTAQLSYHTPDGSLFSSPGVYPDRNLRMNNFGSELQTTRITRLT